MEFQDLTNYDITLIKSIASDLIVSSKTNCRYEAITSSVLGCIYAKGFKLSEHPEKLVQILSKEMIQQDYKKTPKSGNAVIQNVFTLLETMNLSIEKDESREGTWSNPKPSWYTPNKGYKKPWMI